MDPPLGSSCTCLHTNSVHGVTFCAIGVPVLLDLGSQRPCHWLCSPSLAGAGGGGVRLFPLPEAASLQCLVTGVEYRGEGGISDGDKLDTPKF